MQNADKPRRFGSYLFLHLIYWQVMNHMGSPKSYGLIKEYALRRIPAHPACRRNSDNNCINGHSLVVLVAVPVPGTPGWVSWKSEFMLLSREALR